MTISEYTSLINKPDAVNDKQTEVLEKIVQEFPYFQSARALYLKGLYNQNSFKYNYVLKITAAHTTDRSVLFDFITSDTFTAIQKGLYEKKSSEIHDLPVKAEEIPAKLEERDNTVEKSIAASIKEAAPVAEFTPEPAIAVASEDEKEEKQIELETQSEPEPALDEMAETEALSEITAPQTETTELTAPQTPEATAAEKLEIGKPLGFSLAERHSFQEWLQLSKFKPIVRDEEPAEPETEIAQQPEQPTSEVNFGKQKKNELIDKFIETNPKIPQVKHDAPIPSIFYEPSKADNSALMTETLARVYLEQKKYQKAIQAYEILILKYPEKSSFFADRILDIKNLQQNNNT